MDRLEYDEQLAVVEGGLREGRNNQYYKARLISNGQIVFFLAFVVRGGAIFENDETVIIGNFKEARGQLFANSARRAYQYQ